MKNKTIYTNYFIHKKYVSWFGRQVGDKFPSIAVTHCDVFIRMPFQDFPTFYHNNH